MLPVPSYYFKIWAQFLHPFTKLRQQINWAKVSWFKVRHFSYDFPYNFKYNSTHFHIIKTFIPFTVDTSNKKWVVWNTKSDEMAAELLDNGLNCFGIIFCFNFISYMIYDIVPSFMKASFMIAVWCLHDGVRVGFVSAK